MSSNRRIGRKKVRVKRTVRGGSASSSRCVQEDFSKILFDCAKSGDAEPLAKLFKNTTYQVGSRYCVPISKVPTQALDDAFLMAAEYGNVAVLKLLGVYASKASYDPAIIFGARNGHILVVKHLLNLGASIESRGKHGATPLLAAVEYNQEDMVKYLIDKGADVNAVDDERNSILHAATCNGFTGIVAMLLECVQRDRRGAKSDCLNDDDETPIEVAKNNEVCRIILEFCSGYTAKDRIFKNGEKMHCLSPFRDLPSGPASYLFWTALGMGKDNYMFRSFRVYPFDRLNDTERIVVLTEVTEAISGYRTDLPCRLLHESALFAVFAMMKARVKEELDNCEVEDAYESSFLWRKRILEAYEQVYETSADAAGLSVECMKRSVWNTVVNLLAQSLFGPSFWEKKKMFSSPNALERPLFMKKFAVDEYYFESRLPSAEALSQSAVQLTFKKLLTMSKNFLCEELMEPSGCFCQDCIAEREVPLTFKLQFLEETAEEKQRGKSKKIRKMKERKDKVKTKDSRGCSRKLDDLIMNNKTELKNFWSSISIEQKWCLTEMSTNELSDILSVSDNWETLRAALQSYTKYAWEEDLLEITEDCVTIADDMCESKGMEDLLGAMLDAVRMAEKKQKRGAIPVEIIPDDPDDSEDMLSNDKVLKTFDERLTNDEWDRKGRQMLENLVLCEFARKVASQYLLKKEESRAQRAALELELELLQEEEQQMRNHEKKDKRKRKAGKKKKQKPAAKKKKDFKQEVKDKGKDKDSEKSEDDGVEETHLFDIPENDISDLKVPPRKRNPVKRSDAIQPEELKKQDLEVLPKRKKKDKERKKLKKEKNELEAVKKAAKMKDKKPQSPPFTEKRTIRSSKKVALKPDTSVHSDQQPVLKPTPPVTGETWYSHFAEGMMFICSDETFDECMELRLLGLPRQHMRSVKSLGTDRSALFLFNITNRSLHGVFQATSSGLENINAQAWARNKSSYSRSSPFPAQIEFKIAREFDPLAESAFRHVFPDGNRIRKLTARQVRDLVQIFINKASSKVISKAAPAPKPVVKKPKPIPPAPVQNIWAIRAKKAQQANMIVPQIPTSQVAPQVLQTVPQDAMRVAPQVVPQVVPQIGLHKLEDDKKSINIHQQNRKREVRVKQSDVPAADPPVVRGRQAVVRGVESFTGKPVDRTMKFLMGNKFPEDLDSQSLRQSASLAEAPNQEESNDSDSSDGESGGEEGESGDECDRGDALSRADDALVVGGDYGDSDDEYRHRISSPTSSLESPNSKPGKHWETGARMGTGDWHGPGSWLGDQELVNKMDLEEHKIIGQDAASRARDAAGVLGLGGGGVLPSEYSSHFPPSEKRMDDIAPRDNADEFQAFSSNEDLTMFGAWSNMWGPNPKTPAAPNGIPSRSHPWRDETSKPTLDNQLDLSHDRAIDSRHTLSSDPQGVVPPLQEYGVGIDNAEFNLPDGAPPDSLPVPSFSDLSRSRPGQQTVGSGLGNELGSSVWPTFGPGLSSGSHSIWDSSKTEDGWSKRKDGVKDGDDDANTDTILDSESTGPKYGTWE